MASLSKVALETDEKVRTTILEDLGNRPSSSVVPVNALVAYVRTAVPETPRTDRQLARMVFEAAMQLGYGSTSAFVYAFRNEVGRSPQAYMREQVSGRPRR